MTLIHPEDLEIGKDIDSDIVTLIKQKVKDALSNGLDRKYEHPLM